MGEMSHCWWHSKNEDERNSSHYRHNEVIETVPQKKSSARSFLIVKAKTLCMSPRSATDVVPIS